MGGWVGGYIREEGTQKKEKRMGKHAPGPPLVKEEDKEEEEEGRRKAVAVGVGIMARARRRRQRRRREEVMEEGRRL